MKRQLLGVVLIMAGATVVHAEEQATPVCSKYTIRSQGANAARRLAGSVGHEMVAGAEDYNKNLSLALEYSRSFDENEITRCLFGQKACGDKLIRIQGSRVQGRDPNAQLADYFYLPTDFTSEVTIDPRIQNFTAEMRWYCGLDPWVNGLYFWVNIPVTYTKWSLGFQENNIRKGVNSHDAGYFSPAPITRDLLLNNFSEYAGGFSPAELTQQAVDEDGDASGEFFTIDFQPLKCAKFCRSSRTKTTVSDLRAALGWNFLLEDDYHLGANLQIAAPTGNDPKPDFLFAPQNGNDNHWELGAGISSHVKVWRSEDNMRHAGIYFDANLTHMFDNTQRRCFDLCGKPLSRYMIAEQLGVPVEFNLKGDGTVPIAQFKNVFAPVANVTALDVKVSVGVQADIVFMFNYTSENWSWDLGYNFWGRNCEKIRLKKDCPQFEEDTWALKGDAHVFGFEVAGTGLPTLVGAVPLSATQSEAIICGGTNFGRNGATTSLTQDAGRRNPGIDGPQPATGDADRDGNGTEPLSSVVDLVVDVDNPAINTSIEPVFIKQCDIDFSRTKGLSHKLFGHVNYMCGEHEEWVPYVGIGAEVEFGSSESSCPDPCDVKCDTDCQTDCETSCKTTGNCCKCALSQWGIWIKAGVSYS